jgi:hypothetical protein
MFAKLAGFPMFNRIVGRRFGAVACNDNQPIRRSIEPPRRQILHCHWHKAASGALECGWLAEATSASKVEEPDINRLLTQANVGTSPPPPRSICYFRTCCGAA